MADAIRMVKIAECLDLMEWMEPKIEERKEMSKILECVRKMEKKIEDKNYMDGILNFIT